MVNPWAPREPDKEHVPYWLQPRDPEVERRHVELMKRFHDELRKEDKP